MGSKIFISYSQHDSAVADVLCAAIEGTGAVVWMAPRDIQPSSEWAEQIIDGINAARIMLVIFSSSSNRSPQVRREVERAINRDIPVIPFRIENVVPVKSLEYFLSTQHWFDAFDSPLETYLPRLCRLVETLAARPSEDAGDASVARPAPSAATPAATDATAHAAAGSPPAAPAAAAAAGPNFRDEDLAFVSHELARHMGPIAAYLVRRASLAAATPPALIDALAGEFKDPKERAAFIAACRRRFTR